MIPSSKVCAELIQRVYTMDTLKDPSTVHISDLGFTLQSVIFGTSLSGTIFSETTPFGFTCVDKDGDEVVVIRGTETWEDWIENFHAHFVSAKNGMRGRTEAGFTEIYESFTGLYLKDSGKLTVTGHSLGAALATLVATELKAAYLCTFGSPRVGDRKFARYAEKSIGKIERYVNKPDIVTKVPLYIPFIFPWLHVANPITFNSERGSPYLNHCIDTYLDLLQ